ncbi:MAG: hypothetical protein IPL78_23165 [Chloroflexi bacterium]|nr:hypothetical protein [Chloroflexota bacterium]
MQVVDSEGRRALQFQTSLHNGDLTLELATLNQSQFMAFYPQPLYENLYGDPLLLETDLPGDVSLGHDTRRGSTESIRRHRRTTDSADIPRDFIC